MNLDHFRFPEEAGRGVPPILLASLILATLAVLVLTFSGEARSNEVVVAQDVVTNELSHQTTSNANLLSITSPSEEDLENLRFALEDASADWETAFRLFDDSELPDRLVGDYVAFSASGGARVCILFASRIPDVGFSAPFSCAATADVAERGLVGSFQSLMPDGQVISQVVVLTPDGYGESVSVVAEVSASAVTDNAGIFLFDESTSEASTATFVGPQGQFDVEIPPLAPTGPATS